MNNTNWVNVNDRLPKERKHNYQVIAIAKKKHEGGNYDGQPKRVLCQDWTVRSWQDNFTHWRECLPMPEELNKEGQKSDGIISPIIDSYSFLDVQLAIERFCDYDVPEKVLRDHLNNSL